MREASALASRFANGPTLGLAATKHLIRSSSLNTLDIELDKECDLMRRLGASKDYREGVAAFLEKRKPVFTGR
jgi:2-(1,2-epoxy-1,2-dihydrophenyl)acetyl-CoA isomerase